MLGSIYIGLSGMNAFSKGLQTISNNVANMNTLGFKAATTSFTDVFNLGGSGAAFSGTLGQSAGNGVHFGTPGINFTQGDLRQSEGDLDLAIQGPGFLVLRNGENTAYARTGQFIVDEDGYISQQGAPDYRLAVLDENGQPTALNIDNRRTSAPEATTTIKFSENLSSTATTATVSDISVFDSNGGKQVWRVTLEPKTGVTGTWTVTVRDQAGDTVGTSELRFIGGIVDPTTSRLTITDAPVGAAALVVTLDFSQGVTAFSSGASSTLRAASVDGRGAGTLTGVSVDTGGQIELTYSNGETELVGAVALADFRNLQNLQQIGDGLFEYRGDDRPRYLSSGVEGMGKLVAGQLEASNVDLAQQFGDLILIQRGFQASSQVVSVSNDMIQQLFGIRGQG